MSKSQANSVSGSFSDSVGRKIHTGDRNVNMKAEVSGPPVFRNLAAARKVYKKAEVSGRKLSKLQQAHNNRWEESKEYARIATSDPQAKQLVCKIGRK